MLNIDISELDSIIEDIIDIADEQIITAADTASKYAVMASPVFSGLFKANWNASLNSEYDGLVSQSGNLDGESTLGKMMLDIDTFTIRYDSIIFIQNNVSNEESFYASTVSFDYSGDTAERLISKAATTAAETFN
tara:strand:- start:486 stop:890 length:405 start_codon:yes stop_codon:yes gene_type:complete